MTHRDTPHLSNATLGSVIIARQPVRPLILKRGGTVRRLLTPREPSHFIRQIPMHNQTQYSQNSLMGRASLPRTSHLQTWSASPSVTHERLHAFSRRRTPRDTHLHSAERAFSDAICSLMEQQFVAEECMSVRDWAISAPGRSRRFLQWAIRAFRHEPQSTVVSQWLLANAQAETVALILEALSPTASEQNGLGFHLHGTGALGLNHLKEFLPNRSSDEGLAPGEPPWQRLKVSNVLAAFAASDARSFHATGAMGAIHLSQLFWLPSIHGAMNRLCDQRADVAIQDAYAAIARRLLLWSKNVVDPLLHASPTLAVPIAEGLLVTKQAYDGCVAAIARRHTHQ